MHCVSTYRKPVLQVPAKDDIDQYDYCTRGTINSPNFNLSGSIQKEEATRMSGSTFKWTSMQTRSMEFDFSQCLPGPLQILKTIIVT